MAALSAAGNPRRHGYWVPNLSPIPEDEKVWVFQDPPPQLYMFSLLPQRGTHRTVAADVEKFPFRHLHIKRIIAELRSAPTMEITPPLATTLSLEPNSTSHCTTPFIPTATTPKQRTPVDLNAINQEIIRSIQTLRRQQEKLQSSTKTPMTTSPLNPTPTPTITTATVPSNLLPQLTENTATACTSDRLQIQTTTTTTITTPSQLPTQQAFPLPPRSFNLKEQPQQEPITKTLHLNSDNQASDLDQGWSPIICKCPFAFCRGTCPTAASLWKTQPAPLPRPTISCSTSLTEDAQAKQQPTRVPVDLAAIRAQIQANMDNLDRLFPLPKPTTTMTNQTPHQPVPNPIAPTVSLTATEIPKREPVDLAAIQQQI